MKSPESDNPIPGFSFGPLFTPFLFWEDPPYRRAEGGKPPPSPCGNRLILKIILYSFRNGSGQLILEAIVDQQLQIGGVVRKPHSMSMAGQSCSRVTKKGSHRAPRFCPPGLKESYTACIRAATFTDAS